MFALFKKNPDQQLSRNAVILLVIGSLFVLANGLSTVFVTVFIWKITKSYVQVSLYNASIYCFMVLGFILSGVISRRKGIPYCLRAGMLCLIVYFIAVLWLKSESVRYLLLLGIPYGLGYGLFYYSNNTLLYYYTSETNRGIYLGISNALGAIMGILAPTVSGAIIVSGHELQGYQYVFFITFAIYVISCVISYFLESRVQEGDFSMKRILSYSTHPDWNYIMKSNFFLGFREGAIYFIIDILYFLTFRNELSLGGFTTLISMIGVISSIMIGKYVTLKNSYRSILIGSIMTLTATLILVLHTSVQTVVIYGVLTNIFNNCWLIPFYMIQYQVAQGVMNNRETMGDFMIAREIPLAMGRVVGILLFIWVENTVLKDMSVRIAMPVLNAMVLLAYIFALSRIRKTKSRLTLSDVPQL